MFQSSQLLDLSFYLKGSHYENHSMVCRIKNCIAMIFCNLKLRVLYLNLILWLQQKYSLVQQSNLIFSTAAKKEIKEKDI